MQEKPAAVKKDKAQGRAGKQVHGVRLGAKDRSYLVRDKQIEVLKNTYGGVKVIHATCVVHMHMDDMYNTDFSTLACIDPKQLHLYI